MFDAIIRGTLGGLGSAILDFYINNALWINSILLLYALVVVYAKRGYTEVKAAIKNDLLNQFGDQVFSKNEKNFIKALDRYHINWESIAKQTAIPIISVEKSLVFWIKTPASLKKYFVPEMLYQLYKEDKDQPG
jgi:hypothetical protein